jgi:hypothetical protein
MVNETNFFTLSESDQVRTLYEEGSFIMSIRDYGHKVNLFLLYGYYVEVFYNHKLDQIDRIQLLDRSHSRMNFYFDQIKLDTPLPS